MTSDQDELNSLDGITQETPSRRKEKFENMEEVRKAEDESILENSQESLVPDTDMNSLYPTCKNEMDLVENCDPSSLASKKPDPQIEKSSEVTSTTDFLSDILSSLKIRDTLPDSDEDLEDRWVADYVRLLGEGVQEVSSNVTGLPSPVAAKSTSNLEPQGDTESMNSKLVYIIDVDFQEFSSNVTDGSSPVMAEPILNLGSQTDFNLTASELLEDKNSDEPDEVEPSFEQKLKEQKEDLERKLVEARLKRAERQRQHDKELQEQQKALHDLKSSLKK